VVWCLAGGVSACGGGFAEVDPPLPPPTLCSGDAVDVWAVGAPPAPLPAGHLFDYECAPVLLPPHGPNLRLKLPAVGGVEGEVSELLR